MEQTSAPARPGLLTALCILSYIGSGFFALIGLLGVVAAPWMMEMLGGMFMKGANTMNDSMNDMNMMTDSLSNSISSEEMEKITEGMGDAMGMATGVIIAAFAVVLILHVVSIIGVAKMWKLKKSGFIIYTIVNALLLVLFIIGMNWLMAAVTAVFIALYGMNLKYMK